MLYGLMKGLKSINSSEYGREIGLAVVAGAVAFFAERALKEYYNKKEGG